MQKQNTSRGDSSHLAEAIAALKLGLVTQITQAEATKTLIREALMMKRALEFYADVEGNYLDDVPSRVDPETGLLTMADQGRVAQWALRRIDLQLGPAFQREEPEETPVTDVPAVPGDVVDAEPIPTAEEAPDGKVAQ